MELRKNLELVEVTYSPDKKKATMTFLDKERNEIRDVNFNCQSYDRNSNKFIDDSEKAKKVDKWCRDYFGVSFGNLADCVGEVKDVYVYDRYNSLWETNEAEKFTDDMVGQIFQTRVKSVTVDDVAIRIGYEIDGKDYESKMTTAKYVQALGKWYGDPAKKEKQYERFEKKFGVPVEKAKTLVGHPLMVEVKKAFSSYYGDIKAFPKKGK